MTLRLMRAAGGQAALRGTNRRPIVSTHESIGERLYRLLTRLRRPRGIPPGIEVMNPYRNPAVRGVLQRFFARYYSDSKKRFLILGINPGRFGGGVTGLAFTDPVSLEQDCGIPNPFPKKRELSGTFVYEVIRTMGGCDRFFARFFLGAVCPLGCLREGKNFNYYDDPVLRESLKPFIRRSLKRLIGCGFHDDEAVVLGSENARFIRRDPVLSRLFKNITVLDHPRFIMQYRRAQKAAYVQRYCEALRLLERTPCEVFDRT